MFLHAYACLLQGDGFQHFHFVMFIRRRVGYEWLHTCGKEQEQHVWYCISCYVPLLQLMISLERAIATIKTDIATIELLILILYIYSYNNRAALIL